jgi:hypothetical protein
MQTFEPKIQKIMATRIMDIAKASDSRFSLPNLHQIGISEFVVTAQLSNSAEEMT